MDYRKTAQDILDHVGGSKNIASAAHCATRLRLVIADNKKVSKEALENVDGVKGVFEASGQLQIILGTGTVNKVFAEFIDIAGITASSKAEAKEAAAEKQNWFMRAIKLLGDIFVPIIPAIVASGFLMGIMNSLDFMNSNGFLHINTHSSIYVFANLFSNIAYTFLQILIAFSAAKAFGANQYLGAVIGMIMIHPSLQNAYTVATEGVQQTQSVFFGLFKIDMVGYQGHVIPVIIAVWILAVIEKKLHKIVPEVLDLFVTPLVSVFVTGYLTLSIVGPIFVWAENAILGAIQWMLTLPLGIGSLIMGGLYAPTVVTGIHQMYTAIDIGQLAKYGVTYWLPLASAANVAQGAAALAVGIKSKDKKIKSLALPSSLSAFMGITEPAIFGVNLRFFKPFIAGCIGGGCGALYASLVHLGAKGTGVTGIFGILLCLNQPLQYLIEMVIAVGVAFVISFLIYKDAEPKAATETAAVENIETADAVTTDATTADTTAEIAEATLTSPVNGTQIPLSEVADEIFASEMLGTTVAVEPADGKIVAPCDGEVSNIFETGHAVCITTESGGELLIHIGIDTVKMDGKGFTKKVSDGDKVHAGDILVEADLEEIKNAGYQTTTMMILTNTDEFGNVTKAEPAEVKTTSKVMTLTK
ncbi:PTS beta-glucoside transporter subunit IIBCA [Dorea longicatena]|jgi:PTS system sucrose-specific IIC component|uniref:PTS beta-glucoside transporter subunit IIBCA n=1 Tax=Dorea longicatena TaxID=88431 RepID=UPI001EDE4214|nr:PTS beta-glucoside transporter subunit IIBCA [Dorea longicatena]MCB5912832.1 glucose PTS transporter subunit IIA [Lachnospiraceae bacterium 210521-DFI.5.19]MCG4796133.1 glucose PTS transporter subunit IIA [Dorea longicatena]